MKTLFLCIIVALVACSAVADTNFPAPAGEYLQADTNGIIIAPANWRPANDLSSQTTVTQLWMRVESNVVDAAAWSNSVDYRLQDLEHRTNNGFLVYGTSFTTNNTFTNDLSLSIGGWAKMGLGSLVWTNFDVPGAHVYADDQANEIIYNSVVTSGVYLFEISIARATNTCYSNSTLRTYLYLGSEFYVVGELALSATNDTAFYSVVVTNSSPTAPWINFDCDTCSDDLNPPGTFIVCDKVGLYRMETRLVGSMDTNGWMTAERFIDTTPVVTNIDIRTRVPRWLFDEVADVGSQKTYRAYNLTTNGWQ